MKLSSLLLPMAIIVAAPALAQEMSPTDYVANAGASDLYERQSSQLVLKSTKDPKIRSFAQMMIQDHAQSTAQVKAAAAQANVTAPPPALTAQQSSMLSELRSKSGSDRDTTYVTQQKMAHDQALMLHQTYAANGTAAPLKAVAGQIAPVVQHHIEMLKTM